MLTVRQRYSGRRKRLHAYGPILAGIMQGTICRHCSDVFADISKKDLYVPALDTAHDEGQSSAPAAHPVRRITNDSKKENKHMNDENEQRGRDYARQDPHGTPNFTQMGLNENDRKASEASTNFWQAKQEDDRRADEQRRYGKL